MVKVSAVVAENALDAISLTHTDWPLEMVAASETKVPLQSNEYSPPATLIAVPFSHVPVIALDVRMLLSGTSV